MSITPITHVIFDLDGIIVDSVNSIVNIFVNYARNYGKTLDEDIRKGIPNLTNFSVYFNKFLDTIHGPAVDDGSVDRETIVKEMIDEIYESPQLSLIPGVDRLVQHLRRHRIPMAVATGNNSPNLAKIVRNLGDYFRRGVNFDHLVCGWDDPDVSRNKPAPDVYFVCAKRFQTQPQSLDNVLIVEDSLTGITGALDTGMKTLLINDRKNCDFDAVANRITCIVDSFDDFRPESVGLPPYDD
ncbi:pseudouridine-5'-phosphatase-like [Oppia nitens]|uniref:pseudouridine-5'-phosphatase-like n=1 Tax=Oppia nitens TaxID=1686743 RepID=UPI0023DA5DB7|nr:pseudouridine-5'-phosphatase-like [Oppia nitens]